jgi:hypothetical protein
LLKYKNKFHPPPPPSPSRQKIGALGQNSPTFHTMRNHVLCNLSYGTNKCPFKLVWIAN